LDILHILETAVVFAVLLGILVVVHEFGHFAVARLAGMKVHEFAFGFGPILLRLFKRSGTEFNVRAIPLGGFVRIAGMEPGEENVENGFNTKSILQRTLVVLAGPVMSLFLGFLVFLVIGLTWGYPTGRPSVEIIEKGSPAVRAGLQKGDVIYAINGKSYQELEQYVETIHSSPGKELTLRVRRGDRWLTIKATPAESEHPALKAAKTPKERQEVLSELEKKPGFNKTVGLLGFVPSAELQRVGVIESIKRGSHQTITAVTMIFKTIFSKRITKEVGGIVMIGYMTGEMVKAGTEAVFFELAALSVMLGILNLLPWPILDGGHIMFLMLEKIRGKKLEPNQLYKIQLAGMAVLIFLAIYLVYYDVARLAGGNIPIGK
jgi:regulator of sigma E protease